MPPQADAPSQPAGPVIRPLFVGLYLSLTLGSLDALFGTLLPSMGRVALRTAVAELAAGVFAFALVAPGSLVLIAGVSRWTGREPAKGMGFLAMVLGAVVVLPPLRHLFANLTGGGQIPTHLYAMPLVVATPILVSSAVQRLTQPGGLSKRSSTVILATPFVLLALIAVVLVCAHAPLMHANLGAIGATIALLGITAAAIRMLCNPQRLAGLSYTYATLCGAVVIVGLAGALRGPPRPARATMASAAKPRIEHVILLTVDALRADALESYASCAPPTPVLNALAADSVVFDKAISPAPWTLPAFGSIMTGLSPTVHQATTFDARLPDAYPTLAEALRDAGYLTAAIGHNPFLLPPFRINRGFDHYDLFPKQFNHSVGATVLGMIAPRQFGGDASTTDLTRIAIDWLEAHHDRPFFLWLHYFDPHLPYTPPEKYLPADRPPDRIGTGLHHDTFTSIREGTFVPTPVEVAWIRALYDAEVCHVDENIGRVIATLKRLGIYDGSLIVLTSDHGEEFWEHGGFEHGHTVYDELLRVPLFVKLPGAARTTRVEQAVSTESIRPTVLQLCGIRYDPAAMTSTSLAPLWRSDTGAFSPGPIVSTGCAYYEDQLAIRFDGIKYIKRQLSRQEELYDLGSDPGERRSLAAASPKLLDRALRSLARHERRTRKLVERYGGPRRQTAELDQDLIQRLRSLGYVE